MAIRLLIVDDSAFMRKIISDIVTEIQGIEVVGIARNGMDALDIIPRFKPDIITLDIEMPKLDGIETLKIIKKKSNIPVIMLSSRTGMDITIEALQIGAEDFIEKPKDLESGFADFKTELEMKIKSVVCKTSRCDELKIRDVLPRAIERPKDVDAVVIGASTGGPKALVTLISQLPKDIEVPIFIVQHMPKGFTTSFAERLDGESEVRVVEGEDGMRVEKGVVYLAPGDYHMTIERGKIRLSSQEKMHGVRPAVDYLFRSAVRYYGDRLLGIVLTGMGRDGTAGMASIKESGGYNIVQNEETCVVYGMPGNAVAKGVVDEIMSLEDISSTLNEIIRVK
ncbi:protein-glutamate methylesterase/protein-glutamine glutaminase [Tissierellaceae bacterium HCP3S3_D8]